MIIKCGNAPLGNQGTYHDGFLEKRLSALSEK